MRHYILLLLLATTTLGCAQQKEARGKVDDYFALVRDHYTGEKALETTAYVSQYWRVVGNEGFNKSIYKIAAELEAAGYVLEDKADKNDRLRYRIEKRALQRSTWEPIAATLRLLGDDAPLLSFNSNRNMVYINSVSTPKTGITAEVVYIKDKEDLQTANVKGKIIFTEQQARDIYLEGVLHKGAVGILSYDNPSYLQPEKNSTSIQFRSLPHHPKNSWGIALSYKAKEQLKAKLANGPVSATVAIDTKIYPSQELTVIAEVLGAEYPGQRLVFSAHVQEPGANDNASGVGAQLEMAAITAKLMAKEAIDPQRTLTFLWGDEIISTRRYIQEDPNRAAGIKWGISLDMVGENTALTGGTFLIEKMPDPSAIWTRGNDKHSEWGGKKLALEDMKPHYLNDFILYNFKEQARFAQWVVNTNPYEGGSDHTPFLQADIPGLLLWHFTDQFYHTDNDRMDKVSQETLKNVGTAALASAYTLLHGDTYTAVDIIEMVKKAALDRLSNEFISSEKAIKAGNSPKNEIEILEAWEDWYLKAIAATMDMASPENTAYVEKSILMAQSVIEMQAKLFKSELEKKK
ncbi:Peptidase family M28 [Arenibacter nanhaiticus]|uniref:Peptidase family M28 n=1 Tax=Arenibacter nanhaiticus TaxID=558155 RepID=A0A1M6A977_9FLAO|nr:M28 family peptidase [Arenibacter nanhaiticus]SHI33007.1 Peptidase family M28 [Arenibacter nanhaiticus]